MGFLRGIGPIELVIIFAIILLLFGATRLPKLAGSMGKAMREFRKASGEQVSPSGNGRRPSPNRSRTSRSKTDKSST